MEFSKEEQIFFLREANEIAKQSAREGHHPFGAVLVAPDKKEILMEQGNINTVRHAETELARRAAEKFSPDYLWQCTLVTTFEPCVMCAGTQYWANIGTLIYGASETALLALTGNHQENPTMNLSSRTVFAAGQKNITIFGPVEELTAELLAPHKNFWQHR